MELQPQTTLGNFFNQQRRVTSMLQVIESVSVSHDGPRGSHLLKFGVDLLHNKYAGASASRPVLIERADGTLARRLDFSGPTTQSITSTDVALFVQDRFQPNTRWSAEFGGRLDRDGVIGRFNVTPRIGAAVRLNDSGSAILHGGLRTVLRAHAVDGRHLHAVRDRGRFALRHRRRDADRATGPVRPRHRKPRDAADPDVGRGLRPSVQQRMVAPPRRHRPAGQPRADRRAAAARRRRRPAAAVEQRPLELPCRRRRRALHPRHHRGLPCVVCTVGCARRSEFADQLLRRGLVAGGGRERLRPRRHRRAESPAGARPPDADSRAG